MLVTAQMQSVFSNKRENSKQGFRHSLPRQPLIGFTSEAMPTDTQNKSVFIGVKEILMRCL